MPMPQFTPDDVLECARSIRLELPDLLGAEAEAIDRQLADLLAQAKTGGSVAAKILEVLKRHSATRSWAAEFLAPQEINKGFAPLPGRHDQVSAQRYRCPEGDCSWRRRSLAQSIPTCPSHPELGPLIPIDS